MNPRSLANLVPFPPGQSGNPPGRPSFGASVKEFWNAMQGWTMAELQKVANDAKAAANRRIAARQLLKAIRGSGEAIDRIADRTDGKPTQRQEIIHDGAIRTTTEGESAAAALLAQLAQRLGTDGR